MAAPDVSRVAPVRGAGANGHGKRLAACVWGIVLVVATVGVCVSQGGASRVELVGGSKSITYDNYLQSQSHTVEIRQPDHVTNMLRDSNLKVPVACGFGVHCQIHVRPLQVDKTGGAWLGMGRVHGLKELQSTSGASQLTVKGPWAWSQDEARDYASKLSNQGAQDMRAAALLERRMEMMRHDRSTGDFMAEAPPKLDISPTFMRTVAQERAAEQKERAAEPTSRTAEVPAASQHGADTKLAKTKAEIQMRIDKTLHAFASAQDA